MVVKRAALTAEEVAKPEIIYPDTDGMPLPDGFYQQQYFLEIISVLTLFFEANTRVVVSGDTFIYFVEGDPLSWVSPDCYVALDVNRDLIERANTYRVWEVGKVPDFVLEIGSYSTAVNDLGGKRDLYARLGISEYWLFDPSGGEHYGEPLIGEYLEHGEYQRFDMQTNPDRTVWAHSPVLNLDLHWDGGRLRFYDPTAGVWLQSMAEMAAELRRLRGE